VFDNPEITRQLVQGRIHDRRNEATRRRLAGTARRRHRGGRSLRIAATAWFARRHRPTPCLPDHAPA
jgi:hypothetical protein